MVLKIAREVMNSFSDWLPEEQLSFVYEEYERLKKGGDRVRNIAKNYIYDRRFFGAVSVARHIDTKESDPT